MHSDWLFGSDIFNAESLWRGTSGVQDPTGVVGGGGERETTPNTTLSPP